MGARCRSKLNQINTIVPNKSTMLEEDDEGGATSEVCSFTCQVISLQILMTLVSIKADKKLVGRISISGARAPGKGG